MHIHYFDLLVCMIFTGGLVIGITCAFSDLAAYKMYVSQLLKYMSVYHEEIKLNRAQLEKYHTLYGPIPDWIDGPVVFADLKLPIPDVCKRAIILGAIAFGLSTTILLGSPRIMVWLESLHLTPKF